MTRRTQLYVLGALAAVLVIVLYFSLHTSSSSVAGVFAADAKFAPLDVHEPQLRIDLLQKLREMEYSGSHRNIFVATPPPPPSAAASAPPPVPFVGPKLPPPPPPLQVPAEYFGYALQPRAGRRVAFLTSGDDILLVAEGDTFLNRFRVARVGNESLDVQEISTGRHATLPITAEPPPAP
jgi:hypothetical protein